MACNKVLVALVILEAVTIGGMIFHISNLNKEVADLNEELTVEKEIYDGMRAVASGLFLWMTGSYYGMTGNLSACLYYILESQSVCGIAESIFEKNLEYNSSLSTFINVSKAIQQINPAEFCNHLYEKYAVEYEYYVIDTSNYSDYW